MTSSHTLAVWLFERLDLDVALTGDLLEERERGRSAIWYWRQVLIAVWFGIWGAIRDHKLMALRAVATGFAMEYSFLFLWEHRFFSVLFKGHELPLFSLVNWIANLSIVLFTQTATGWVVARTHRAHQIPMVFVFLICFLLWFFGPQLPLATRMLADWDQIDPTVRPYPSYYFSTIFVSVIGALLGATLARPKRDPSFGATLEHP